MGSDNLASFHRWRNWQEIAARLPIAVVTRPGTTLAPLRSKAAQRLRAEPRLLARRTLHRPARPR